MRTDVLLDDTGEDLAIANGDFKMGRSDLQNCFLIIRLHKGNLKQYPLLGYGEERLINGPVDGQARREIQLQLQADGYRPKRLDATSSQITIEL
jgi:hypothetical protein